MTETTAMMVRTPMMMPRSVRKVLSLLTRREAMAIEKDSLICSLAIVFSVLFYTRSYGEAKKRFSAIPCGEGSGLTLPGQAATMDKKGEGARK
jgi:hypothetical protein